jgi:DNA-binding SARP family transcriptional activator/class 3 adenylate cyclase
MWFRLLGPLDAFGEDRKIMLGGTKQRATLGFLLLQANRVVATSALQQALWPVDDAPASARKILQNAIWGLRRVLTKCGQPDRRAELLTQAPGYRLRVDPDDVDLYRFNRQVELGRERLTAGAPEAAANLLRDALALWQGPALADLVETGIAWPELAAVENTRLDAMEDYFEAELACGRHYPILGELETMVETEMLRERFCGQLMVALYRCGRQADALAVYSRVRAVLVEQLGLEPGRELQRYQQAILNQDDPALAPSAGQPPHSRVSQEPPARPGGLEPPPPPATSGPTPPAGDSAQSQPTAERKRVSLALVRAELGSHIEHCPPDDLSAALESVEIVVRQQVERFGGTVVAELGSLWLAAFGADSHRKDGIGDAVLATLTIRESLGAGQRGAPPHHGLCRDLLFRAAVATGEALVRRGREDGDVASITGSPLDQCQSLVACAAPGEIWACDDTRQATRHFINYSQPTQQRAGWRLTDRYRSVLDAYHTASAIERVLELDLLRGLLCWTRRRSTSHLVTILGERGVGKTRLLTAFADLARQGTHGAHVLLARTPSAYDGTAIAQRELLASYQGPTSAPIDAARARLGQAIDRAAGEESAGCGPLVEGWRAFVQEIAADRPVILFVDDLHHADDTLLGLLDGLTDTARLPLLIVAAVQPDLVRRRPRWGGGLGRRTTIPLEPLSDAAIDQVLDYALSEVTPPAGAEQMARRTGQGGLAQPPEDRRRHVREVLRHFRSRDVLDARELGPGQHGPVAAIKG